jgi:hypothetical protein
MDPSDELEERCEQHGEEEEFDVRIESEQGATHEPDSTRTRSRVRHRSITRCSLLAPMLHRGMPPVLLQG